MKTLSTNQNNDIIIQSGNFVFAKDAQAVLEISRHNVLTNYGELVYDALRGVHYFSYVLGDVFDIVNFERDCREEIMRIDGVISIPAFTAEAQDGVLRYMAVIETKYGQVIINADD